jgi:hypothetical protein
MSNGKTPISQVRSDQMLQAWQRLAPLVSPSIWQWAEQAARTTFASPLPTPRLQEQLERDVRQSSQMQQVLNDASLAVEDKVMLMLMLIMKKMDEDIEKQAAAIQAINAPRPPLPFFFVPGGAFMGGGMMTPVPQQGSSPSIDVETQKLQRMIQKRSQMFEMLSRIMEHYNETAKSIVQNLR